MPTRNARSPRRIDFDHKAFEITTFDEDPPAEDSIAWKLWLASQDLAQPALETDYIQGIAKGMLFPNFYGQYNVQDCAYCYNAEDVYLTIRANALNAGFPELAAFAEARYESYVKYTKEALKEWHISDPDAVVTSEAAQKYIDFERSVADEFHPIYGVIAMFPCYQLWPWLADKLNRCISPKNVYSFWIKDNAGWNSAYRMGNFINSWFASHPDLYYWESALYAFRGSMTGELNFFKSAGGQTLAPMPSAPPAG